MKRLKDILLKLMDAGLSESFYHINTEQVHDITYDSREVQKGTLFFCKGLAFKKEYLEKAIAAGAVAYVSEVDYNVEIPAIIVKDIRKAMVVVGGYFFDYPDRKLNLIGVTGTKGKTTAVKFMKSIFDTYLHKHGKGECGIISSMDTYDGVLRYTSELTTPEAIPLYRNLFNAVASGLDYVLVEVSSQALKYDRVSGLTFAMGVFLNVGEDHVSEHEHPDHEDYFRSKLHLVDLSKEFIFNSSMDYAERVQEELENQEKEYETFSLKNPKDTLFTKSIENEGTSTSFVTNEGESYHLNHPGEYNIENALAAILVAQRFGIDTPSIQKGLHVALVEGRNTFLTSKDKTIVCWINYAHNGLSFEKSFDTMEDSFSDYRIISIFGAPGNRARSRLVEMSTIAAKRSDEIFLVPDDPGTRKFEDIAAEMGEILESEGGAFEVFTTRAAAIEEALLRAQGKTIVFIAGKGADKYNIIGTEHVPMEDDVSATKRLMKAHGLA